MIWEITKLLIAALLGGLITMAIGWPTVYARVKVLGVKLLKLNEDFTRCYEDHLKCPEEIRAVCKTDVRELTLVVEALTKTTSAVSADFYAHLRVTNTVDSVMEKRFERIEAQLNSIERKLDELKGWKMVRDSV